VREGKEEVARGKISSMLLKAKSIKIYLGQFRQV
jgi:hypothetical protein